MSRHLAVNSSIVIGRIYGLPFSHNCVDWVYTYRTMRVDVQGVKELQVIKYDKLELLGFNWEVERFLDYYMLFEIQNCTPFLIFFTLK